VHLENLAKFAIPIVVAINRFPKDTEAELRAIEAFCAGKGVVSSISEVAARGGPGGTDLATKVKAAADGNTTRYRPLYQLEQPILAKIDTIAREIYRADGVELGDGVADTIARLERDGYGNLPLCIAKTQLSVSDDPTRMGAPTGWRLRVRDVKVSAGAGFVVVMTGSILLMPGMPKDHGAAKIRMDADGRIHGLS
jgi:formate--tetrahydrofolate ligase